MTIQDVVSRIVGAVRGLLQRRHEDADLDDELRAYLDESIRTNMAAGLPRLEAERRARAAIGSTAAVKDHVRDAGWERVIDGIRQDLRAAVRRLRAAPALAAAVVMTLGLGVGVNTAMFSVADTALFKPSPYIDPEQLVDFVQVIGRGTAEETRQMGITWAQLDGWRTQRQIFAGIETFRPPQAAALDGGETSNATQTARISPGLVRLLGLSPVLGRNFGPGDVSSAAPVAILGENYWRHTLRGDRDVIGRTIGIDGRPFTIVGVLPATLSWWVEGRKVAAWLPLDEITDRRSGPTPFVGTMARLAPQLTFDAARRAVQAAAPGLAAGTRFSTANGHAFRADDMELVAIDRRDVGTKRRALLAVLGAGALVLLIACANVANLLVTNTLSRRREIAVRIAIGSSRGRIIRQLLTENALLIAIGGSAGWLLAIGAVGIIPRFLPDDLRLFEMNPLTVDMRSMLFCGVATGLTGLLCCLAPAVRGSRSRTVDLADGGHRSGRSRGAVNTSRVLQTVQMALAVVLLASTSLLTSSFVRMVQADTGYDVDHLATLTLSVNVQELGARSEVLFFDGVLARIRQMPGIRVAAGNPPTGAYSGTFVVEGRELVPRSAAGPSLDAYWIDPDYLALAGISLKAGRTFSDADVTGSPNVALIDERAAAVYWPGGDPIGKRLRISPYLPWATVIGVVNHIKTQGFADAGGTTQTYFALAQGLELNRGRRPLLVRSRGDWTAAVTAVREATKSIRPRLSITEASAVGDLYGPAFVTPRFVLILMTLFAALALATAATGLYGTLSDVVAQRTNEIGIRMALGARASHVGRMVVGEALLPVVIGLAIGLSAFWFACRLMSALLFDIAPRDPWSLACAVIVLVAVAVMAALPPTRRAIRVDPVVALRED